PRAAITEGWIGRRGLRHPLQREEAPPTHVEPDAAQRSIGAVVALELGQPEHLPVEAGDVLQRPDLDRQVMEAEHLHPATPGPGGGASRACTTLAGSTSVARGIGAGADGGSGAGGSSPARSSSSAA